jgi:hypothetical protein
MDDPSGRAEVAWAHRVEGSTARWREVVCAAAFRGGDEGAVAVGDVLEVL